MKEAFDPLPRGRENRPKRAQKAGGAPADGPRQTAFAPTSLPDAPTARSFGRADKGADDPGAGPTSAPPGRKKGRSFFKPAAGTDARTVWTKLSRILALAGLTLLLVLLLLSPDRYGESVLAGARMFCLSVMPSLFPFFVITRLLTALGAGDLLRRPLKKPMEKLFGLPPQAGTVFALSALSGYPVGAKLTAELCLAGGITPEQAKKMSSFCSTSGPLFVVGSVGAAMFASRRTGYLLLLCHLAGALLCGLLFCRRKDRTLSDTSRPPRPIPPDLLGESVYDSVLSVFRVGGFITLFYTLADMLVLSGLLSPVFALTDRLSGLWALPPELLRGFLLGLLEMTRGCLELGRTASPLAPVMAAFLISFGGVSINMQALSFLKKCNIKARTFFFRKTVHAFLSALLAIPLFLLL